jgi:hypothetical protein
MINLKFSQMGDLKNQHGTIFKKANTLYSFHILGNFLLKSFQTN